MKCQDILCLEKLKRVLFLAIKYPYKWENLGDVHEKIWGNPLNLLYNSYFLNLYLGIFLQISKNTSSLNIGGNISIRENRAIFSGGFSIWRGCNSYSILLRVKTGRNNQVLINSNSIQLSGRMFWRSFFSGKNLAFESAFGWPQHKIFSEEKGPSKLFQAHSSEIVAWIVRYKIAKIVIVNNSSNNSNSNNSNIIIVIIVKNRENSSKTV